MKRVTVTQWVRAETAQVPPDQRLASRSGANSTGPPSHGRTELAGASMPAAGWSPARCLVVDSRIALQVVRRGTPTGSRHRKAAVLGALWRGRRTPPGSKSGACRQRGSSGTWQSHRSPCHRPGLGDRGTQSPGGVGDVDPTPSPPGTPRTNRRRQGSGVRAPREGPREGQGGSRRGA